MGCMRVGKTGTVRFDGMYEVLAVPLRSGAMGCTESALQLSMEV